MSIARIIKAVGVAACLLSFSAFVQAQDDVLGKASRLVAEGKAGQAYELLSAVVDARAGDPQFDYLLGIAALDAGKPTEAVFALERVLDVQPGNAEARAELARAYYRIGENDAAKQEFELVREEKLPPKVAAAIDRYLAAIEYRFDTTRTQYHVYVESGFGYDTNVNSATDRSIVAVPFLGPVMLTEDSREQGSGIWDLAAGFQFSSPLRSNLNVYGGASADHRLALGATKFTAQTFDGNLGLHFLHDQDQFRVAFQGQRFDVGGDINREFGGFTGQWQRTLDPRNQVTLFGQLAAVRFPGQDVRNVNRYAGGAGWGHAFAGRGAPVIFLSAFGGTEVNLDGGRDDIGRNFVGMRAGGQYRFSQRLIGFGALNYQYSHYGADDPLFLKRRNDNYVGVTAGLRYALDRNWSLRPELRYSHNNSTLPINEYDRFEAMVYVRNDF